ncbi:SDR family NAD(P)-dependent oxidoreductase [Salirhabdus sp. Marseille-P4669]|uniref:SDR family NAD(P)-dependent oxidoreductase n=1 Tax=Salirhabdus sp. Marseille-P4669 TaxID=2042310 RepID=UPI000C7A4323|nr:SDR family oxidoreductase [Salirhabdus sp. Marseille-P4669]
MNKSLNGKNIIITGASSGIGQQLAWQVAENKAMPILVARSEEKLKSLAAELKEKLSIKSAYYVCDIGNKEQWQQTMESIVHDFGHIHVLINNAGFGVFQQVDEMDYRDFEHMFAVNVHGLIQASQFFLLHMLKKKEGHIVNIASQAGKMATPKAAGYASTKHAVLGFTNGLRMEVEKKGIYVTAVNLGPVKTSFFQTADPSGSYEKAVQRYLLDPEKVARTVVARLYRPTREINLPKWMEFGSRLYQLFPSLFEKVFRKQFSKK